MEGNGTVESVCTTVNVILSGWRRLSKTVATRATGMSVMAGLRDAKSTHCTLDMRREHRVGEAFWDQNRDDKKNTRILAQL